MTLLALFAMPARSIQAQPVATPGELTFFKECEDGLTGTFPVLLDFEFEPDDIDEDNGAINEDTAFDTFVMVTCGENTGLAAEDLVNVFAYVELVCGGNDCPPGFAGTVELIELGLPEGTTTEYAGNFDGICDGAGTLNIVDTTGELGAFFEETGLVCEIINTPGDEDDDDDGDNGIDIDIDNTNNNNIDIDSTNTNTNVNNNTNINENKNVNTNVNTNVNKNEQNQSNDQSQNNSNNQTNNVNSSPHVNIDFD